MFEKLKEALEVFKLCLKYKFETDAIKQSLKDEVEDYRDRCKFFRENILERALFDDKEEIPSQETIQAFKDLINNQNFKKTKRYLLGQYINKLNTYGTNEEELVKCHGDQRFKEGLMFFFTLAEKLVALEEQKEKESSDSY